MVKSVKNGRAIKPTWVKIDKAENGRLGGFPAEPLPAYHFRALAGLPFLPLLPIFGPTFFNSFAIFCALPVLPSLTSLSNQ